LVLAQRERYQNILTCLLLIINYRSESGVIQKKLLFNKIKSKSLVQTFFCFVLKYVFVRL
jgi:hypothetical protein